MLCLLVGVSSAWAEDVVYKAALFGSSYNSAGVQNYTSSFSATNNGFTVDVSNFNNNNNGWDYIKTGNKTNASVGTITTNAAIDKAITKVVVTIDAVTASNVNSITLYSGTAANSCTTSEGTFTVSTGAQTVAISSPAENKFYKISFDCKKGSSNGLVTVSKVQYYYDNAGGSDPTPSVTAPAFDVAAGTYTEDKLVLIDNYDSDYLYAYTTDGSDPAIDAELNVTNGTEYDENEGITITSSCTLKAIAVDEDGNASSVTSAAYVINKPIVFASLEELVAADLTSGTNITVSFENVPIKSFQTVSSTRKGVYFDIQKGGNDIEIYFNSAIPNEWVEGGTLSGTLTNCPWKLYSSTWELAPASGWTWTNLTYNAPAQKTITALVVSGTPTKTTYNVGDAFETAGLVVTATYDDDSQEAINAGFDWEIDYGQDNTALVAGATSVDVMVYTDGQEVMSAVYTVTGLTVNVPVTLTSIAVSGTPTKTEYYAGDAFETAGLVVTGTYSDSHQETITEGIDWTVDPETLTLGTTSVDVMASVGDVDSEVYTVNDLTVTENPIKVATKNGFSSGDNSGSHNFTDNTDISFEAFKGNAGTAPAINSSNLRLYQGGGYVTIKGAAGVTISQVKITTSATYASTTVGYCVDEEDAPTTGETVARSSDYTITDLNNQSVSIYCLGTTSSTRLEIAAIEVKYTKEDIELSSIALSGEYQTEFIQNQTFNHDGIVVTATFSNGQNEDVTATATFSDPDMTTTGTKTITVSYTDADVTKTAEYDITVAEEVVTAIALSGDYQTTFRVGDTFNHDNLEVKATYNSGRTDIDVTSAATVSTPDMSVAGEQTITVSYGGQSANYTIKVLSANTIFYESFDTNNGTGGNDGLWSGSIAANNISSDNDNWTFAYSGGANKCAKFGTGSAKGAATTPALGHEGAAIMTFKSAAWNGGSESLVVNLSVVGDGAISQASITNKKGEWTEYTVTLTGLTAESKVKFEAANASNNRFFLDEIYIEEAAAVTIGQYRYATFVTPYALDFSETVVKAYKVSSVSASAVILTNVEQVPAGTPVILKGDAGNYVVPTIVNANPVDQNLLEVADANIQVAEDLSNNYYILTVQNETACFAKVTSGFVKEGKCYFKVNSSAAPAPSLRMVFDDEEPGLETGVGDIIDEEDVPLIIHTLQGVKVEKVQKNDFYIVNRKHVRYLLAE